MNGYAWERFTTQTKAAVAMIYILSQYVKGSNYIISDRFYFYGDGLGVSSNIISSASFNLSFSFLISSDL